MGFDPGLIDWDVGIRLLGSGCPGTGFWVSEDWDLGPETGIWEPGDRDLSVRGPGFGHPGIVWKGLESPGGLWRGLGTPRSQDFEDVSSRLLDSGGPGTGRAMVGVVILCGLGPLRNQYLGLRT